MNVASRRSIPRLNRSKQTGAQDAVYTERRSTAKTVTEEQLPYSIKKRFFLIRQNIVRTQLHYVPCWHVVLDYKVTLLTKNNIRTGTVDMIVDEVKGCSAVEPGFTFKTDIARIREDSVKAGQLTGEQAEKKAKIDARWKVVMGQYKRPPELFTKRVTEFLRPYYEVEVEYGGRTSTQWVPADGYDNYITYQ